MSTPVNPPLRCVLCQAEGVTHRSVDLHLGSIDVPIEVMATAPLCDSCASTVPDRVSDAMRSPMIRAALRVFGF